MQFTVGQKVKLKDAHPRVYSVIAVNPETGAVTIEPARLSRWEYRRRTEHRSTYTPEQAARALQPYDPKAKEAARLVDAMTCQCCGRPIMAKGGTVAHHGYERPAYGYQTASCFGARALPFEVSRDALGEWLDKMLLPAADAAERHLAEFRADVVREVEGPSHWDFKAGKYVAPKIGPEHEAYPHCRRIAEAKLEQAAEMQRRHATEQQRRYDTWGPGASWKDPRT